jgi:hypothetical protein
MASKRKWIKVGTVLKKKKGEGSYIKVTANHTLKEGQFLQVFDPRKNPNAKEEDLEKIRDFVLFEIFDVKDVD